MNKIDFFYYPYHNIIVLVMKKEIYRENFSSLILKLNSSLLFYTTTLDLFISF